MLSHQHPPSLVSHLTPAPVRQAPVHWGPAMVAEISFPQGRTKGFRKCLVTLALRITIQPQFSINFLHMGLDGGFLNAKLLGDIFIRHSIIRKP